VTGETVLGALLGRRVARPAPAYGRYRKWVLKVLDTDVAGSAREPRAVLLLLAVTVNTGLDAGVRRRPMMEGRGLSVALDTAHLLRMALLARVAAGARSAADGSVRQGSVMDVFVGEPGKTAACRMAGPAIATSVEHKRRVA
jgi:hypothetical protein